MAIRLVESDCVIYEMPKTGTTFVRKVIESLGIDHVIEQPILDVCPRHSPWWCYEPAAMKVSIVRHPVSWYESFYSFHRRGKVGSNFSEERPVRLKFNESTWYVHRPLFKKDGVLGLPFDAWLDGILLLNPGVYSRMVDAFVGPLDFCAMDLVMRTETLSSDLADLLESLGYKFDKSSILRHQKENVSRGGVEWIPHHRQRVVETEQSVIRRFYG